MAAKSPIPKDPIQTHSLSKPIFIATGVLLFAFGLAMWDEFFWRRPYKEYQKDFSVYYYNYLTNILPGQEVKLREVQDSDEYRELSARRDAAKTQADPAIEEVAEVVDGLLTPNIKKTTDTFKIIRSKLAAKTYRYEIRPEDDKAGKDELWAEMEAIKKGPYSIELLDTDRLRDVMSGVNDLRTSGLSYADMAKLFKDLKDVKGTFERRRAEVAAPVQSAERAMAEYVSKNMAGPHPTTIKQLLAKADDGKLGPTASSTGNILQIHVKDIDWVDRCEACHAGMREPIEMPADVLAKTNQYNGLTPEEAVAFTSHPNPDLLAIHSPEEFGCSMCHNGNGRSITSVKLAHGKNKHWLYPLYHRENFEAGCVQCHSGDLVLEHAPTLNEGKWLFQHRGCVGCHKYNGFDTPASELRVVQQDIAVLREDYGRLERRKATVETAEAAVIDLEMSGIVTKLAVLDDTKTALALETQKVGPSLRNLKRKVVRGWLPGWVHNPKEFRPSTKMPVFRLTDDQATKIAAFLWQSSDDPSDLPRQPQGDAARGEALFSERGCLGCHTITDADGKVVGDGFATDLSRVGDKMKYDFLVKWIKEPDNGVMPDLRLSWKDSQDIATYLMTRKTGQEWPDAQELEDQGLFDEGMALVRHNGCAGCHDIDGMESEGRIGTELTVEGSKPKERLDFGRLEHDFKMAGKWTHKAFFETKLSEPDAFGKGKVYHNPNDALRMPDFHLKDDEVDALTTFLLGSIDSEIPKARQYNPTGDAKAIQEGWWVVKKYNCVGCHQLEPTVQPELWSTVYAGELEDGTSRSTLRPPSLVGQGFRTDPVWLAEFLRNPSLMRHAEGMEGNGVRGYLDVRMPTFRLSEREIAKIVNFFGALASQPEPFVPADLDPLETGELTMARTLMKSLECVKCHMTGEAEWDAKATAPNLTHVGERLKADWLVRWLRNPALLDPGTSMPANFKEQVRLDLANGTSVVGVDLAIVAAQGQVTIKVDGNQKNYPIGEVSLPATSLRWVADPVPPQLANYEGDHIDLIVRYLKLNYDEAEIPLSKPDKQ